jgi:branched-chain amino acid aminotransferase
MEDETRDFSGGVAYVEGRFVPIREARVPVLDWGFLRSDATYDVAHVWQGRFFRLNDHLARFERGIAKLRMNLPVSLAEVRQALIECVRLSGFRDAYVEMICTRGVPPPGSRDPRQCRNAFFAFAAPFVWIAGPEKQKTGLSLRISSIRRIPAESVDPTVKNYHWSDLTKGLFEAYDHGDETTVLTDGAGRIVEGPGFNIFALVEGALVTPASGVLEGITRRTVIELASRVGIVVREREVGADELRRAEEVFVTSTAGGIMPVTRVDGSSIGDGRPGSTTLDLGRRYWQAHADPEYGEPIDYSAAS